MRATNIVMLGSANRGKEKEYRALFAKEFTQLNFKALDEIVFNPKSLDSVENGKTYFDNAYSKGHLAHMAGKYPTISDDTGLEVDALDGRPGVFSARFSEPRPGLSKDDSNIQKLLTELKGVSEEQRTARFVCTVVFFVEGLHVSATETLEGKIIDTPRGNFGFGYDRIFVPAGFDKTLAEMTLEEKNTISHRAKALRSLMRQIHKKGIQLVRP